ncbi:hypothetical protein [Rhizobium sp. 12,4]|uniref:hypothetical protein n=1 Tax=Rhizobium sp. 12,4 TaxID=3405135 RepID=UPI003D34F0F7
MKEAGVDSEHGRIASREGASDDRTVTHAAPQDHCLAQQAEGHEIDRLQVEPAQQQHCPDDSDTEPGRGFRKRADQEARRKQQTPPGLPVLLEALDRHLGISWPNSHLPE